MSVKSHFSSLSLVTFFGRITESPTMETKEYYYSVCEYIHLFCYCINTVLCRPNLNRHVSTNLGRCSGKCIDAHTAHPGCTQLCLGGHLDSTEIFQDKLVRWRRRRTHWSQNRWQYTMLTQWHQMRTEISEIHWVFKVGTFNHFFLNLLNF